ncbi:MAG: DUF2206 domain-containing protein [Candidatus Bathyarchaeota archaeon]|nr:DUF2206 domain-containing protein [Candidatus Bathyarchaeota archaeon]
MNSSTKVLLAVQAIAILTILLDIPVARQIIGFIYLMFLPGYLLLRILKLNVTSVFETVPLSVGLSLTFSMFLGLAVNQALPFLGITAPLSVLPLLVVLSAALFALTFIADRNPDSPAHVYSLPAPKQLVPFIFLAVIPVLSLFGALYHSSWALLLMVALVSVIAVFAVVFRRWLPSSFFPIAVAVIGLSLIFQREFISANLLGYDTFGEFYVFSSTNTQSLWDPYLFLSQFELRDYNSMLSVTVLPTMFSQLLNITGEWIFKIPYFLLYCLVPLTMYQMYKQGFGKGIAFLGAFYFILFPRFYGEERRQTIGELFLVLILYTILTNSISPKKKELLIGIFGIALVVSHYSTFYVFIFCALATWASLLIMENLSTVRNWKKPPLLKRSFRLRKVLTARVLFVIIAFAVLWYTLVSTSLDQTFMSFVNRLATTFSTGFFDLTSRGGAVSGFISPDLTGVTLAYQADFFISKIPYVLIGLGLVVLLINRKKLNLQAEYIPMALAAAFILIMTFVLPSFADAFVEDRFFHLLLIFLAPLSFYGGYVIITWASKHFTTIKQARTIALVLLCVIFVAVFLVKVGFVYEVTDDLSPGASSSMSFSAMEESSNPQVLAHLYGSYVPDCDVYSAEWLSVHTPKDSVLFADADARQHVLRGYALRVVNEAHLLSVNNTITPDSYIYLRYLNTQGCYVAVSGEPIDMAHVSDQLTDTNRIYSDGGSEIYYSTP